MNYLVGGGCHAARVEVDVEGGTQLTRSWSDVDAVGIAVVALGEDHTVEGSIEFNVDSHVRFLALHLEILDLGLVTRCADRPLIFGSRTDGVSLSGVTQTGCWWWR